MGSTKHGVSTHFEFLHRLASGEIREVEVYTGPLDVRGRRLLFSIIHDITDRKRAEAELEHIYANARCLLWHADVELRDGEEQWSIRVVNEEAAQRYLPLKLKPGESYFDALMDNREEFHDEARELDRNAKRAFQEGASRLQHEFPCRRSDGEIRWIYEDAYIQPAGAGHWRVVGVSTDITDRRKAEGDLKQTLSLLAATLESTTDGILVVDAGGRVTSFNRKFVEMWRIPAELAATRDDATIMDFAVAQLADPEGFHTKVDELYASPDRESFDVLEFKDGRVFERYSLPQRLEGRSVGRVWSFRDVTERKRAEEERERLEAQILHAQKLESLGILAGGIAHDFNNILTSILGNAELAMLELPETTPAHANMRNIELSARRAAELTRQMLAYSGKGRFLIQQIRIPDEVREMIPLLGVSISKKCTLTCRFAENVPVVVGDASQIRQVIMNLIVNASEAIGDNVGEITISAGITACDRSYLSETYIDDHLPQGEYVFLEVSDTGCGISPEVRAKLFDPFFTTKFTGRGLGLAAVMGVVRGHQGAIRVTSEPGHGATFRVLFPAADSGVVIAEDRSRAESGLRGCGGTVLVVDDETAVRDLARAILERAGYQVMTAADGRQAVDVFQEHADEIKVVLLDMTMPHMSGGEAFREIRRIRGDCRIVLSSGYSEVDARSRFGENELAGFIQKPFRMAELLEAVWKALKPAPQHQTYA
ncbi:MAG: response regulator [Candidatus Hydrogenedentes bacterium]|nr:response regulator [Candidatus Hydrogenedentota bacterium]